MSKYYVFAPGDLDPPKKKSQGSMFVFSVNTDDLLKELRKFSAAISTDLRKHLGTEDPGRKIQKRITGRLGTMAPRTSRRIQDLLAAMSKRKRYRAVRGRPTKHVSPIHNIMMQMIDIPTMDTATNLGRLDKLYPQRHIAEFAGNPVKKLSPAAKTYREQRRFSLWRMYEYYTPGAYTIPKRAKGPLLFTSKQDGNSSWIVSRKVQYTVSSRSVASSSYYILNDSRKLYKGDKQIFANSIGSGIKRLIATKTRFK